MTPIITSSSFPAKKSFCIYLPASPECKHPINLPNHSRRTDLLLADPTPVLHQSSSHVMQIGSIRSKLLKGSQQTQKFKNGTTTISGNVMAIVLASFFLIFLGFLVFVLISRCPRSRSSRSRRNPFTVQTRRAPQQPSPFTHPLGIERPASYPPARGVDVSSREGITEGDIGGLTTQSQPLRYNNPFDSKMEATYVDGDVGGRLKVASTNLSNQPLDSPVIRKLSFQSQGSFDLSGFTMWNQHPFDPEGSGESSPGAGMSIFPLSACPSDSFRIARS
ncbi:hypothetical protein CPB83DRAFT_890530 [Crepidotus variabilis]|uniref:Uncharacterized protein n=1 Tax=Crepidotus variabilis TaxID=179855 RepID=A0A9P6JUD9_9AGAR|nr:hypothetical protein CPB83DRAFT_890530 [Crepidotus variabilis]